MFGDAATFKKDCRVLFGNIFIVQPGVGKFGCIWLEWFARGQGIWLQIFAKSQIPTPCPAYSPAGISLIGAWIVLALSSAISKLPNETLIFHDFQGTSVSGGQLKYGDQFLFKTAWYINKYAHSKMAAAPLRTDNEIPWLSRFSMTCTNAVLL